MALEFKFKSETMDKIMYVVRTHNVNPSVAVDLIVNNENIYKEAKNAIEERGKRD